MNLSANDVVKVTKHTIILLFECSYALQVWRASGISNTALQDPTFNVEEKLAVFIEHQTSGTSAKAQKFALWLL